jgi:hypothetical protein
LIQIAHLDYKSNLIQMPQVKGGRETAKAWLQDMLPSVTFLHDEQIELDLGALKQPASEKPAASSGSSGSKV